MSSRPSQPATWATDANYVGGPENGTSTKTEPSAGRKAEGYEPNTKPTAQELNWQLNLIYLWILYLDGQTNTVTEHVPITGPASAGPASDVSISGAGVWFIPLAIPGGRTIKAVRARVLPGAATTVRASTVEVTDGVGVTTSVATSTGGAAQTIDSGAITLAVVANKAYEIKFDLSAGTTLSHVYALEVDHVAT